MGSLWMCSEAAHTHTHTHRVKELDAQVGEMVYVSDTRRWLGGLRSSHAVVSEIVADWSEPTVELGEGLTQRVVASSRSGRPLRIRTLLKA